MDENEQTRGKVMMEWEGLTIDVYDVISWEMGEEYQFNTGGTLQTITLRLASQPYKKVCKYQTFEAAEFAVGELKRKMMCKNVTFI